MNYANAPLWVHVLAVVLLTTATCIAARLLQHLCERRATRALALARLHQHDVTPLVRYTLYAQAPADCYAEFSARQYD